jgi:hypothetical protein
MLCGHGLSVLWSGDGRRLGRLARRIPIAAWNIGLMWEPAEIRTMKRRWRDIGDPATFDGDSVEAAVGGPTPDDLVDGLIGRLG